MTKDLKREASRLEEKRLGIEELAQIIGGRIEGGPVAASGDEPVITGVSPIESASAGDVTFVADARNTKLLGATQATAVILKERDVNAETDKGNSTLIFVDNPHLAMARALEVLRPAVHPGAGISPGATLHESVVTGTDVSIGANTVIEEGVLIGDRAVIYPSVYIGRGSEIGEGSILYPNVTVMDGTVIGADVIIHPGTVIGSDGFGYAKDAEKYHKIPQTGTVRIEDSVELGACVTVDRAMLGVTTIGRGTKVDNLVQIAHNVTIGENSIIVAQVGIAGSSSIGSRVQLGGQVGVVGHVSIGNDILIGARGVVTNNLTRPGAYSGFPAVNHGDWLRSQTISQKLPELRKRIRELERRIAEIEESDR